GWRVDRARPGFGGREALARRKAEGPSRKLVGLRVGVGGVPRQGFAIVRDVERIGVVTSGTFSPTLKGNIAMGYVPLAFSQPGQAVQVEMRGKAVEAEVVPLPFVPHRSRQRAKM